MLAAFFCASEKNEQPKKQTKSINRFIITALSVENKLVFSKRTVNDDGRLLLSFGLN